MRLIKLKEDNAIIDNKICPLCSEIFIMTCRCRIGSKTCKNGHHWFVKDNKYYIGNGHDIPGIPLDDYLNKVGEK